MQPPKQTLIWKLQRQVQINLISCEIYGLNQHTIRPLEQDMNLVKEWAISFINLGIQ